MGYILPMYIDIVPNRNSKPAYLLRESYREGDKIRKRTLANLSQLPYDQVVLFQHVLKGEKLVPLDQIIQITPGGTRHHGHVQAVFLTMQRLGISRLLASRPSRERDLALALIASRVLAPQSKLATPQWWKTTSLPELFNVADADEEDIYRSMDWLLKRQQPIEAKLAARHLTRDGLALYDLSSSYFEGVTCPLASFGHNRDGKTGKLQVNYGLLTDGRGIPCAISVYEGKTGDPKTLMPQVERLRESFGIERIVLVGDRGMITQKSVAELREMNGIDWIGALRPDAIRGLLNDETLQMGLFDERNLFEICHPNFPDERLIACRNLDLQAKRAKKRQDLIAATERQLEKIKNMVERGKVVGKQAIEEKVQRLLNRYKVGKYVTIHPNDQTFEYEFDEARMSADAGLSENSSDPRGERKLGQLKKHLSNLAKRLDDLKQSLDRGRLYGREEIGLRVGKGANKYKVAKHFKLSIDENRFDYEVDQENVAAEAMLDGIYVVRTSLPKKALPAEKVVLTYKSLSQVERAFRTFKGVDLKIRPIFHRLEDRVRAHIFLCMLAYYVQWHMKEAWRPLLFADEDQEAKETRDPIAAAKRSPNALEKIASKKLADGQTVHSFQTLLSELSTIVRNDCHSPATKGGAHFVMETPPDQLQEKAFKLLEGIKM